MEQPHNFGPCSKCCCLTTRLMEVTDLCSGVKEWRICCRAHPSRHWRLATMADVLRDQEIQEARKGA